MSDDKVSDLITIGIKILRENKLSVLADQYFVRRLQMQEDKFEALIQGDAYQNSKQYEKEIKYYIDANSIRPDMFQLHLRIIKAKLELQQFQEALDYSINLQIPKDQQAFIDLGLIFCDYDQTIDKGQQYISNGVDVSQNKYETLKQLIKSCSATRINKCLLQQAMLMDGCDSQLVIAYADHMKDWDGTLEEKIDAFKRVISLNPQSDYFYHYLIEAYTKLDKVQEGIDFMLIDQAINHLQLQGLIVVKINNLQQCFMIIKLC